MNDEKYINMTMMENSIYKAALLIIFFFMSLSSIVMLLNKTSESICRSFNKYKRRVKRYLGIDKPVIRKISTVMY